MELILDLLVQLTGSLYLIIINLGYVNHNNFNKLNISGNNLNDVNNTLF